MRRIFKTSLLIATIAFMHGVAVAGTVMVNKQTHSTEGLNGVTASQTSNPFTYILGAAYAVGDKITFIFQAGVLDGNVFASGIEVPAVDSATPADAIAGLSLGILNSDANSATYRVTAISQPDDTPGSGGTAYTDRTTNGASLTFGSVSYQASSVSAAGVTITVTSETSVGDVLDSFGTLIAIFADAKSQFGVAAVSSGFDNLIDVETERTLFTNNSSDNMMWSVSTPDTTGWLNLAIVNQTKVTLFGEPGKMTDLQLVNFSSSTGTPTFTVFEAKLEVVITGLETNGTITFNPPGNVVLEEQQFNIDVSYDYTSAGAVAGNKSVGAGLNAGEWTLNGATFIIPYMPYSATASQILYVTNVGSQAGDIVVEGVDSNGDIWYLGTIGVAGANRVTKIAQLIGNELTNLGFVNGKVSFRITVNAPDNDIFVYASYNAGGVRGYVEAQRIRR